MIRSPGAVARARSRGAAVKNYKAETSALPGGLCCEACDWRAPLASWSAMVHVHHVRPIRSGGENGAGNLIALCPNCHAIAHRVLATLRRIIDDRLDRQLLLLHLAEIRADSARWERWAEGRLVAHDRALRVARKRAARQRGRANYEAFLNRVAQPNDGQGDPTP